MERSTDFKDIADSLSPRTDLNRTTDLRTRSLSRGLACGGIQQYRANVLGDCYFGAPSRFRNPCSTIKSKIVENSLARVCVACANYTQRKHRIFSSRNTSIAVVPLRCGAEFSGSRVCSALKWPAFVGGEVKGTAQQVVRRSRVRTRSTKLRFFSSHSSSDRFRS